MCDKFLIKRASKLHVHQTIRNQLAHNGNSFPVMVSIYRQLKNSSITKEWSLLSVMAALRLYREKIHYLSTSKIIKQRKEISRNINRDAFFPLNMWLSEMRLLFCCSPDLICLCSLLPNSFYSLLLSHSFHLRNQQGSADATIFYELPWRVKIY